MDATRVTTTARSRMPQSMPGSYCPRDALSRPPARRRVGSDALLPARPIQPEREHDETAVVCNSPSMGAMISRGYERLNSQPQQQAFADPRRMMA